jgi:hypothetical protein
MNTSQNEISRKGTVGSAEETLRVIASLPAPDGLVDRVQTRLRTAPRTGKVLTWPMALRPGRWVYSSTFRGAAAAAIVCVVVGGGWRIYSRVQPVASARILVMPAAGPSIHSGGFSIGGSIHTPDPRTGPAPTYQVVPEKPGSSMSAPPARQPGTAAQARKQGKGRKAIAVRPANSQQ